MERGREQGLRIQKYSTLDCMSVFESRVRVTILSSRYSGNLQFAVL
jgi:hypothetical protein